MRWRKGGSVRSETTATSAASARLVPVTSCPATAEPATITVVYPSAQQDFRVGPASAAVPGMLGGLLELHRRHGSLPLADVVAPSVELARAGAVVDEAQAYVLTLIEAIVRHTESAASVYAPEGRLLRAGEVLRDDELAEFLARIADGESNGWLKPTLITLNLSAPNTLVIASTASDNDRVVVGQTSKQPV